MIKATTKEEKAMIECYRRLYKNSNPSANFDELLERAPVNSSGQKVIDFDDYEIPSEVFFNITEEIIKEYKIKPKFRAIAFQNSILLGCSPKFSKQ